MNMKMYKGQIPPSPWAQVHRATVDGVEWLVFEKSQAHSDEWVTYKVVANGRASSKANYWMARNKTTGKIAFARDYAIMKTTRPELFSIVEGVIDAN